MNNNIFWLYHKETGEPWNPNEEIDALLIDATGRIFTANHNGADRFFDDNYEVKFHRHSIKHTGPTLQNMLNDCVDDGEDNACIWDNWQS